VIHPFTIGLPILKITFPIALPKINLPCSTPLILYIVSIISDPISLKYLNILSLDFLFSLRDLILTILYSLAME
jgi:hypothetical protein